VTINYDEITMSQLTNNDVEFVMKQ